MIATLAPRLDPVQEKRHLDRDDAVCNALRTVVNDRGLDVQAEADVWLAARTHIDAILHMADAATVARIEADATLARIARHFRQPEGCPTASCSEKRPCNFARLLALREKRLRKKADDAYLQLARGRR